jgi:hypothetical protein
MMLPRLYGSRHRSAAQQCYRGNPGWPLSLWGCRINGQATDVPAGLQKAVTRQIHRPHPLDSATGWRARLRPSHATTGSQRAALACTSNQEEWCDIAQLSVSELP